ncbi:MAG TPA: hypothetical protein VKQ36_13790 [Ktedonobacterales bacterium]|nr:hypothetical protein [Ktedonobacterales bacterium]
MATVSLDNLRFDRRLRTASSEGYYIIADKGRLGMADLHFAPTTVHCTLILEQELERAQLARLIDQIDEDLVLSADIPRENFMVTVYTGREVGMFSDDFHADDDQVELDIGGKSDEDDLDDEIEE